MGSLLVAYAVALALLHPFANTLYGGDDWAYAWSVERLLLDGKLIASSWVTAAAIPQVLWASAFCKLFGFSYRVLNLATMLFAAFAPVLAYLLGIELGSKPTRAALTAFFCVINPLFLGFASSFMSDAYYAVFVLATLLAYARGLRKGSVALLLFGSVLASIALLQRQIGVATPAAVVFTLLIAVVLGQRAPRRALLEAAAAGVLPAVSALVFKTFPDAFGGVTATQQIKLAPAAVMARFKDYGQSLSNSYTLGLYLAVFALPVVVALLPALLRSVRDCASRAFFVVSGLLVAASGFAWLRAHRGSLNLTAAGEFMHLNALPPIGVTLWQALSALASVLCPILLVVLGVRLWRQLRQRASKPPSQVVLLQVLLALTVLAHALLIVTFVAFFNNYFLPLVMLSVLLASTLASDELTPSRWTWALPAAAALFVYAWSARTLDVVFRYVEANDRATSELMARGVRSEKIFDYAPAYARRHYDLADRETRIDPWSAFSRLRRSCEFVIIPADTEIPGAFRKTVLHRETYHTLAGDRVLEVRGRGTHKHARY